MEYRKIIEFGKSSYVVSLPKQWLSENKLGKGDVIYVNKQGENLVVYPVEKKDPKADRSATIDVTELSKDEIRLQLVSMYIRNFNSITLTSENLQSKAKDIRSLIHDLMALEVVEETSSRIVTKDFLNMDDICPLELIKKMDSITREMLRDSKNSPRDDNYANLAERDSDVNRLSYLLHRTIRYIQKRPILQMKRGIDQGRLLAYWTAGVKIESIADQAKRISRILRRIKFKKQEEEQFNRLYTSIEKYYHDCMEAVYENNAEKAFRLVPQKRKLIKQCRDFCRQNWNYEWVPLVLENITLVAAESKAMLTYICDMD
jgi:phosphate transport system protein